MKNRFIVDSDFLKDEELNASFPCRSWHDAWAAAEFLNTLLQEIQNLKTEIATLQEYVKNKT